MDIILSIPKEFEENFNKDKFKDCFERIIAETNYNKSHGQDLIVGNYELETCHMLIDAFENSKSLVDVNKLANEIVSFCKDYDFYEFLDNVDDEENLVLNVGNDIISDNTEYLRNYLSSIVDEEDPLSEESKTSKELIDKLTEFSSNISEETVYNRTTHRRR